MTDSGGFQIFSLGWGKVHKIGKVASPSTSDIGLGKNPACPVSSGVKIGNNGVVFTYDVKNTNLTREFP